MANYTHEKDQIKLVLAEIEQAGKDYQDMLEKYKLKHEGLVDKIGEKLIAFNAASITKIVSKIKLTEQDQKTLEVSLKSLMTAGYIVITEQESAEEIIMFKPIDILNGGITVATMDKWKIAKVRIWTGDVEITNWSPVLHGAALKLVHDFKNKYDLGEVLLTKDLIKKLNNWALPKFMSKDMKLFRAVDINPKSTDKKHIYSVSFYKTIENKENDMWSVVDIITMTLRASESKQEILGISQFRISKDVAIGYFNLIELLVKEYNSKKEFEQIFKTTGELN